MDIVDAGFVAVTGNWDCSYLRYAWAIDGLVIISEKFDPVLKRQIERIRFVYFLYIYISYMMLQTFIYLTWTILHWIT